jgi:hypothetical protein
VGYHVAQQYLYTTGYIPSQLCASNITETNKDMYSLMKPYCL